MKTDVIVVGGGPVGLTLACELRLAGLDVLVLERRTERVKNSRGLGMHGRTLEMLGMRGLAPRFRERALPFSIGHFAVLDTRLDFAPLDPQFGVNLVIHQAVTEELLETRALELGVRLRRGALVQSIMQTDEGVAVAGEGFEARAAYLVGTDGARSLVRSQCGIAFEGEAASFTVMLGDVRLSAPPSVSKGHMQVNEHGVLMAVPLGDGLHRVIVMDPLRNQVPVSEAVTMEELSASVRRAAGADWGLHDAVWLSRFSDETRLAAQYRQGRILLAGDAAHIHLPAGGQGMNVGMQDAFNLGWKLASVVRGSAGPELLDSYESERRAVGQQLMQNTKAQAILMKSLDPRGLALRHMMSGLLQEPAANRKLALEISGFGISYPASLTTAPAGARLLDEWTGVRMADTQLALPDGVTVSLHGLLEQGEWLYLRLDDHAPTVPAADSAAIPGRVRTVCATAPAPALPGVSALLIRPDGYADWALAA